MANFPKGFRHFSGDFRQLVAGFRRFLDLFRQPAKGFRQLQLLFRQTPFKIPILRKIGPRFRYY